MRFVHPMTWLGLALNIGLVVLFLQSFSYVPLDVMAEVLGPDVDVEAVLRQARTILVGFIVLQLIAVGVLIQYSQVGLLLAVTSGLVMLPISLVFTVGAIHTFYAIKYSSFEAGTKNLESAKEVFVNSRGQPMRTSSLIMLVIALGTAAIGMFSVSAFFIVGAPVLLYLAIRARRYPALEIYDDKLGIVPQPFAPRISIPYSTIRTASLLAHEIVQFHVETAEGTKSIDWSLQAIFPEERKRAVEVLASTLKEKKVHLI